MATAVAAAGQEVLIVGIENTSERLQEYGHTDDTISGTTYTSKHEAYAELVSNVVRPLIEAEYATTELRGIMGSSMGGVASLALAHGGDYDFVASLSGNLGWGHYGSTGPSLESWYVNDGPTDTVVFVDSGGSDGGDGCTDPDGDGLPEDDPNSSDNYCTSRQFADALAEAGYVWNSTLYHWHEANASHNEAAWAARVHRPLGIFLALDD